MANPENPYDGLRNTKEEGLHLYLAVQGGLIIDEFLTSHFVKLHKMFEGFP